MPLLLTLFGDVLPEFCLLVGIAEAALLTDKVDLRPVGLDDLSIVLPLCFFALAAANLAASAWAASNSKAYYLSSSIRLSSSTLRASAYYN